MKNNILWKSWDLMSLDEQNEFKKDALDYYLDNNNEDIEDYDEEAFEDYCREVNDSYFDDDFGVYGNWKYSPLANQQVAVTGILGLWNGKHKVIPKKFDNLREAILACMEDYNIIAEDGYGNLIISAYHHDGQNKFIIKKVTDKGLRCLHFRREVFGCR